jgi:heme o synthase
MQSRATISFVGLFIQKLKDIALLYKLRLGSLVIFSSVIGYLIVAGGNYDWLDILLLALGGGLVTSASNAINQIFEKDVDSLMNRTRNRPLPTERMTSSEASLYAGVAAVGGLLIITYHFNPIAGLLSAVALISYAFIYTPMKRFTSFSVFVGAIPGALPPMIGAVAFEGYISTWAILLFAVQFIWQFPHFWAIAWVSFDDYKKADIMLLPSKDGKCKNSALITFIYTLFLLPVSLIGYFIGFIGLAGTIVTFIMGAIFIYYAFRLLVDLNDAAARKLMFASFFYLLIVLIAFLADKI